MDMLLTFDEETIPEELDDLGSYNHSYIQIELGWKIRGMGKFTVLPELSLNVESLQDDSLRSVYKQELKPDLAVYPVRPKPNFDGDILRMEEMPLLVIEVLSPTQSHFRLFQKVGAYFALGVNSCWIVAPLSRTVTVYTSPTNSTSYAMGQTVVDERAGIEILVSEIF